MSGTKIRAFIDMDGVIADFNKLCTDMGITGEVMKRMPGAFYRLEPMPDAIAAVKSVIGMGFDVFIATKPPTGISMAYADKVNWILRHLPELKRKIILTHDKGLLGCSDDVLIDDRPHKANCESFPGELIVFGGDNGKDWPGVLQRLREKKTLHDQANFAYKEVV